MRERVNIKILIVVLSDYRSLEEVSCIMLSDCAKSSARQQWLIVIGRVVIDPLHVKMCDFKSELSVSLSGV